MEADVCGLCHRHYDDTARVRMDLVCSHSLCLACTRFSSRCPECDVPLSVLEKVDDMEAQPEAKMQKGDDDEELPPLTAPPESDSMAKQRAIPARPLTLQELKNVSLPEENLDWQCPICTAPYDNDQRVPMVVDACFEKKPNMYAEPKDDDPARGSIKGCGHCVCEPCSLQLTARSRNQNRCPSCRSWIRSWGPDLVRLHAIASHDGGRHLLHVRLINQAQASVDPLAQQLSEMPKLKKVLLDKNEALSRKQQEIISLQAVIANAKQDAAIAKEAEESARLRAERIQRQINQYAGLTGKLAEQEKISRDLFEDIITSRIRSVASGALPASQLDIVVDHDVAFGLAVKYTITTESGNRLTYVRKNYNMYRNEEELRCALIQRYMAEAQQEGRTPTAEQFEASHKQAGDLVLVKMGTWLHQYMESTMMPESMLDDTGGADMNTHYLLATPSMLAAARKQRDDEERKALEQKQLAEAAAMAKMVEAERAAAAQAEMVAVAVAVDGVECISCMRPVVVSICPICEHAWCNDPLSFCRHLCPNMTLSVGVQDCLIRRGDQDPSVFDNWRPTDSMWEENWYRKACEARIRKAMEKEDPPSSLSLGVRLRHAVVEMFRAKGVLWPDNRVVYDTITQVEAAILPGHKAITGNVWYALWHHLLSKIDRPKQKSFLEQSKKYHLAKLEKLRREIGLEPVSTLSSLRGPLPGPFLGAVKVSGRAPFMARGELPAGDFVSTDEGRAAFVQSLARMNAAVSDRGPRPGSEEEEAAVYSHRGPRPGSEDEEARSNVASAVGPLNNLMYIINAPMPVPPEVARELSGPDLSGAVMSPDSDQARMVTLRPAGMIGPCFQFPARLMIPPPPAPRQEQAVEHPPNTIDRAPVRFGKFGPQGFQVAPAASPVPAFASRPGAASVHIDEHGHLTRTSAAIRTDGTAREFALGVRPSMPAAGFTYFGNDGGFQLAEERTIGTAHYTAYQRPTRGYSYSFPEEAEDFFDREPVEVPTSGLPEDEDDSNPPPALVDLPVPPPIDEIQDPLANPPGYELEPPLSMESGHASADGNDSDAEMVVASQLPPPPARETEPEDFFDGVNNATL